MLRNKKYEKQMKKIIIINNNLKIGGIQKALINLLNEVSCSYDITLLLFRKVGQYLRDIPQNVKVLEVNSDFQYLAISQSECVRIKDKIKRALYVIYTRFFGFSKTIKLLNKTQKKFQDCYDVAISFQHSSGKKSFYGGTAEFVLNFINADKKICFIHCDYQNSGTSYPYNDKLYKQFDRIACVSESVKNKFLKVIPEIENKTVVVRNCNNVTQIKAYAEENTYIYDKNGNEIASINYGDTAFFDNVKSYYIALVLDDVINDIKEKENVSYATFNRTLEKLEFLRLVDTKFTGKGSRGNSREIILRFNPCDFKL